MLQQKLQTRLAQKLILTPSLQQAIKLLPMTTIELVDMLNQETAGTVTAGPWSPPIASRAIRVMPSGVLVII